MLRAVDFMSKHNGKIHRHPGGYWTSDPFETYADVFNSSTVAALVDRGVARYVEWKVGYRGKFPIVAELVPPAAASNKTYVGDPDPEMVQAISRLIDDGGPP
jgi:hypothetical protein